MRILVIDPSLAVRSRLVARLHDAGLEVIGEAGAAADGLGLAARLSPRVVILDLRLPDGSGLEVLVRLKATSPPPVVVVVTNEPGYREVCLARGADGFLDKSMDFDAIEETLRDLCTRAPPRRPAR